MMNRYLGYFILVVMIVFLVGGDVAESGDKTAYQIVHESGAKYEGIGKCKTCHMQKNRGNQYDAWRESAHAKAYQTLGTEAAINVAAKVEVSNPQEHPSCLRCHALGFNLETGEAFSSDHFASEIDKTEGVQCESCHGPGSLFAKSTQMKKIKEMSQEERWGVGFYDPQPESCLMCHNDGAPCFNFDGFDYKQKFAKIAHPLTR